MRSDPDIGVTVEDPSWPAALPDCEDVCRRAVTAALGAPPGIGGGVGGPIEVGLLLADDATVRDLNRTYRGQDKPTNVLSFPGDAVSAPAGEPRMLGDIVLAYGTVAAEAAAQGKTIADHLAHLVVPGILHLLGHDHENDAEAEAMERAETAILAGLGIADPYVAPPEAPAR
ncbi:MAG: rRNA maturation RNase YbeY [Alphaproteobacteria bacterium]